MKRLIILISFTACFLLQACDKEGPGDNYDFSNSLPPYVTLSSTAAKTVKQGASTTFSFVMKTSMQQPVTVTYKLEGSVNLANQKVIIARDALSATATVTIPAGTIVPPATTATAKLTLVSAVKEDGTTLTLGSVNNAASQVVTINITP